MTEIKGHIHRILWNTIIHNDKQKVSVGLDIIDIDNQHIKIKGIMKIEPYPSINDYIYALKNGKIDKDMFECKTIKIELPIKPEFIFTFIKNLQIHSKTKLINKEIQFLIDNNDDIWNKIYDKKLNIGKINSDKINLLYDTYYNKCVLYDFKDDKQKLIDFFNNNNIVLKKNQIDALLKKYDNKSFDFIVSIIINNLIDLMNIDGFSIKTVMNIATSLNYSTKDKIELFILYRLYNSPNGDTCILYNTLLNILLKDNFSKNDIEISIQNLLDKKYIVEYNDFLYHHKIWNFEKNIGFYLQTFNNCTPFLQDFFNEAILFLDNYSDSQYPLNQQQYDSFISIFKHNINITIGPAGAGKSEILIRLCKFIDNLSNVSILFLTPTGKACDRLTKGFKNSDVDHTAFTIHKFNYYKGPYTNPLFDDSNIDSFNDILNNHFKIFVIDEISMISLQDFNCFIEKIKSLENCVIFMLGDINQLPSISYGDVLNQLVLSNAFNVVKLTHIYRTNAFNLLKAQQNVLLYKHISDDFIDNDNSFIWINHNPLDDDFVLNFLTNNFKTLPFIITSTNEIINNYQFKIKNIYNPNFNKLQFVTINNVDFHINDIIMIKNNDYTCNLMNGMIGKIISIIKSNFINNLKSSITIEILFEGEHQTRSFSLDVLDNMSLAYLITIHKSQGSESDNVVILLDNAIMNTINLLYTAITRTKKKCFLIADQYTLDSIIKFKKFTKRFSNLQDFCNIHI